MMEIQWKDNVKARILNESQNNAHRVNNAKEKTRAQLATYEYLRTINR